MQKIELGEVQERFANLIWECEPVKSMDLVKICNERFEWNKSTTFTVLRKLCEKGARISLISSSLWAIPPPLPPETRST